jgi:hypothetical protein
MSTDQARNGHFRSRTALALSFVGTIASRRTSIWNHAILNGVESRGFNNAKT